MTELLANVFVTVTANVLTHFVCKWLDGHRKDS